MPGGSSRLPMSGTMARCRERKDWLEDTLQVRPDDEIPSGDETNRLHRWGYTRYREMFNARQLLALELSARIIAERQRTWDPERPRNKPVRPVRYQNMLCRYDTTALKSLDIFSIHGSPSGSFDVSRIFWAY